MIILPIDKRIWRPNGGVAKKSEYESATSLEKYLDCPVVYYNYYSSYRREAVTPPALLGRAVHEAIRAILVEKMLGGVTVSYDMVQATFYIKWNVELLQAKNQTGGINWDGLPSPMQQQERGALLMHHWARDILPEIDPKAVEEGFSVRLKDVKSFLTGRWDLVTPVGFVDHKTGSRPYKPHAFDLQMVAYYLGHVDKYGFWPKVEIHFLSTVGDLEATVIPFEISKSDVQQIIHESIKPAMVGIAESDEKGIWDCRCGKHKDVIVSAKK